MRRARSFCFQVSALLLVLGASTAASLAHAESVVWNYLIPDRVCNPSSCGTYGLQQLQLHVSYYVQVTDASTGQVLSDGSTVHAGTRIKFKFIAHEYAHVSWFSSGYNHDCPYGDWAAGAGAPPGDICIAKNDVGFGGITDAHQGKTYAVFSVTPPSKSITGLPADCTTDSDGVSEICSLDNPGTVTALFNFAGTQGKFYGAGGLLKGGNASCTNPGELVLGHLTSQRAGRGRARTTMSLTPLTVDVPAQSIPVTLTVLPSEDPAPSTPILTSGAASCTIGTPHSITMTATAPDGDQLRYAIDWNADGSIDEYAPPTGYVPSGTAHTATRTYATAGEKTVKVLAQDEGGGASDWATLAFSCTNPPPPPPGQCEDNLDNDGDSLIDALDPRCSATAGMSEFEPAPLTSVDLSLRVLPSLIRYGNTTRVHWSATGLQSCAVTAANGDNWTSFESPVGGQASRPITGETTYTLSCIDTGGATLTRTATVRTVPVWRER